MRSPLSVPHLDEGIESICLRRDTPAITNMASLLATTLSLAAVSATLALSAPSPSPAPAPVASGGFELLIGSGVNEIGGQFSVFVFETPMFTVGHWSYVSSGGFEYGGTLDVIHVDGDSAYASGSVTYSNGPPVGFGVLMKVTDNGGFWSSTPDSQSAFVFRPPGTGTLGGAEDPASRAFIDTAPTFDFTSGHMFVVG